MREIMYDKKQGWFLHITKDQKYVPLFMDIHDAYIMLCTLKKAIRDCEQHEIIPLSIDT